MQRNIPVFITAMPASNPNRNLIDKDFLVDYRTYLSQLKGTRYPSKLVWTIDLFHDGNFSDADFEDSAHLNAAGADKFFNAATDKIAKSFNTLK